MCHLDPTFPAKRKISFQASIRGAITPSLTPRVDNNRSVSLGLFNKVQFWNVWQEAVDVRDIQSSKLIIKQKEAGMCLHFPFTPHFCVTFNLHSFFTHSYPLPSLFIHATPPFFLFSTPCSLTKSQGTSRLVCGMMKTRDTQQCFLTLLSLRGPNAQQSVRKTNEKKVWHFFLHLGLC